MLSLASVVDVAGDTFRHRHRQLPKYGRSLSEDSEVLHANIALQPQPVGLRSQYGACLSSFVYFYERKAKVQIVHHAPVSSRAPGDREFINVLLPVVPIADVLPPVLP